MLNAARRLTDVRYDHDELTDDELAALDRVAAECRANYYAAVAQRDELEIARTLEVLAFGDWILAGVAIEHAEAPTAPTAWQVWS